MKLLAFFSTTTLLFLISSNQSVLATDDLIKYSDSRGRSFYVDSLEKVPLEYQKKIGKPVDDTTVSRVKPGGVQLYEKEHYSLKSVDGRTLIRHLLDAI